jgi:hypothetical protein
MNKSLNRSIDYSYNDGEPAKIADIDYSKDNPDPSVRDQTRRNWQSQQIAGILTIVFFGIIAIVYVFYVNAFIVKDDETNTNTKLIESSYFQRILSAFSMISLIIIIFVLSFKSADNVGLISACSIVLTGMVIYFVSPNLITKFKTFFSKEWFDNFLNFIDHFFGYNLNHENEKIIIEGNNGVKADDYKTIAWKVLTYSLFAPFIIFMFIFLAILTDKKIVYSLLTIGFAFEYILKARWNELHFFDNFESIGFIWQSFRIILFLVYLFIPFMFFMPYYGKGKFAWTTDKKPKPDEEEEGVEGTKE